MFDLSAIITPTIAFVKENEAWAPAIVFALAFGESIALLSFFIPATALLVAVGALVEAGGLNFWHIWLSATLGATLGDSVSYWVGFHYKERAKTFWPLNHHPDLVRRAEAFFARFGIWSVAIGRFFGPIRAIVPLLAGILAMPQLPFQLANISSAALWSFALLAPGAAALKLLGM
ncbi:MAG: DedA family protein [Rhizobiales bacterium 32-66-8]|nr:MAG: DedA family protein [Rhizobiales bacterium 32-66-8]